MNRKWQTIRWVIAGLIAKDLLEYTRRLQLELRAEREAR